MVAVAERFAVNVLTGAAGSAHWQVVTAAGPLADAGTTPVFAVMVSCRTLCPDLYLGAQAQAAQNSGTASRSAGRSPRPGRGALSRVG